MIMKKSHLRFCKAQELLSDWSPVCYSNLTTRCTILELPMLAYVDICKLIAFDDWFIAASAEFERSLQVIIKNSKS